MSIPSSAERNEPGFAMKVNTMGDGRSRQEELVELGKREVSGKGEKIGRKAPTRFHFKNVKK